MFHFKPRVYMHMIGPTKNECDAWFETRQFFLSINQSLISYWQNLIQGCFQLYFSNGSKLLENFCQNNEPDFRNGSQRRIEEHSTKGKPKFCPWYWKYSIERVPKLFWVLFKKKMNLQCITNNLPFTLCELSLIVVFDFY